VYSRGNEIVLFGQLNLVRTWTWSYSSVTWTWACNLCDTQFTPLSSNLWCTQVVRGCMFWSL